MQRVCPVCKLDFEDCGDAWKTKCFDCYKNFRMAKRIQTVKSYGSRHNEIYLTHPNVTKEELEEWIKKKQFTSWLGASAIQRGRSRLEEVCYLD